MAVNDQVNLSPTGAVSDADDQGHRWSAGKMLIVLTVITAIGVILFMTIGARGSWSFILPFRGLKVATMAAVGCAAGLSTVVFQTLVGNRILTPAMMGFDALYRLIQTGLTVILGGTVMATMPEVPRFAMEAGLLCLFAMIMYRWLFSDGTRALHLIMLMGIVFSVLFRSLSSFLERIIDPNAFVAVQDRLFASFNHSDPVLLATSAVIIGGIGLIGWRNLSTLDVLVLGRDGAIGLGVSYTRVVRGWLMAVSLLLAVSTALVGPLMFLGLLGANLAYGLISSHRHAILIPAASLIATAILIYGQLVVERLLAYQTAVGLVIEVIGGVVFLGLLLRGKIQ